jgi:PIN domain
MSAGFSDRRAASFGSGAGLGGRPPVTFNRACRDERHQGQAAGDQGSDQGVEPVEPVTLAAVEAMKLPTARSEQRSDEFDLEPEIAYRADLWRTLTNSGVRLLDLPDVAHRDLVERALARRAPFDDRGQAGYRDALIWHNLLEIAASGQMVIFVTNDGDFLDRNDRTQLHPDLVQDVRVAGLDPTRIRPVGSLKEAVNEVIEPGAEDPRLSARSIGKRRELEGRSVLPAPGASRGRGQPRRVRR